VPAELKRRVQLACGSIARSVQVIPNDKQGVLVKVQVDNATQQAQVMKKLLALPEMASPQVHLEVEVRK
jgi:hypothetical protein